MSDCGANRSNDRKLTLEWVQQPDGSRALVFDAKTWAVFERSRMKGKTAQHVISAAVAECVGTILMDNYTLSRCRRVKVMRGRVDNMAARRLWGSGNRTLQVVRRACVRVMVAHSRVSRSQWQPAFFW